MDDYDLHELEGVSKLTPRDYGKLRNISPQLVYYHIREGRIKKERCACGRSVIDVDQADQHFKKGQYSGTNHPEAGSSSSGSEAQD